MSNTISRRHLLKAGALLAGGLPFAAGLLDRAQANPTSTSRVDGLIPQGSLWTEKDIALNAPAELKARLFANENPFGPSDKAKKAILEALPKSYQYPFMFLKDLSGKIAEHEGIKEENILMASGSSPLLMAAAICF